MLTEWLVDPEEIEPTLRKIWKELEKSSKIRASLFTLIVYHKRSERSDYLRNIVLKLIQHFPCRVLFITADPNQSESYLKTAVSIITPNDPKSSIACDNIDIAVAGAKEEILPYLLLSHLLPDLPVNLLWAEEIDRKIFPQLQKLATKVIFDSEIYSDLPKFCKDVLDYTPLVTIADLNWARIRPWRELISNFFENQRKKNYLTKLTQITITYNAIESRFFCHEKVKAAYLQAWLAALLQWKAQKLVVKKKGVFSFSYITAHGTCEVILVPKACPTLMTGSIAKLEGSTEEGEKIVFTRDLQRTSLVCIEESSKDFCALPYFYSFEPTETGKSLAEEIFESGSSKSMLQTFEMLIQWENSWSC